MMRKTGDRVFRNGTEHRSLLVPDFDGRGRLAEEQRRIAEIGRIVSSSKSIDEIYSRFSGEARALVGADRLVISVFSEDRTELIDEFIVGADIEGSFAGRRHAPEDNDMIRKVIAESVPVVASADSLEIYRPGNVMEDARRESGLTAVMLVPLIWQGSSYGILSFRAFSPTAFGDHEADLAVQMANQIAGAISTLNQNELHEHESLERKQLAEIGRIVSSTLNISEVYPKFAPLARALDLPPKK
jgi:transcriptional regulator with GAF, ATPase, and Fis domain